MSFISNIKWLYALSFVACWLSACTPIKFEPFTPTPEAESILTQRSPSKQDTPDPISTISDPTPPNSGQGGESNQITFSPSVEEYGTQILAFLNGDGSPIDLQTSLSDLTGAFSGEEVDVRARIYSIDFTGDETLDILLDIIHFYPWGMYEGALIAYSKNDGAFVQYDGGYFSGQFFPGFENKEGIRTIVDMNLNGTPEIVLSTIGNIGNHANHYRSFQILEWNGERFADLIPLTEFTFSLTSLNVADVYNGDGEIRDTDGNGTLELVLTNGIDNFYVDSGPQRARTDIWAWNGQAFTLHRWEYTSPEYRIQAVWDGDDASRIGNYGAALIFYQRVLVDDQLLGWSSGQLWPPSTYGRAPTPAPDPDERARLAAYSRYRMMLLHAAQGNWGDAEAVYTSLQTKHPEDEVGHQYAFLAQVFWEEATSSETYQLACDVAIQYAALNAQEILSPLGYPVYLRRNYAPHDICPFSDASIGD